jgi:DNA (cytosine-5)-methyltransferase 3A
MVPMGLFGELESIIEQPKDKGILLRDILEENVDQKYYLSEKMIEHLLRHSEKTGKKLNVKNNSNKSSCFTAGGNSGGKHSDMDLIVVHNMMPRSSTTGKGGTGPLSRSDGKTYCLDTGNTNAVQHCNSGIRRLTPTECERLQTVPDGYTNHVSDTQRYKMLGNGWTIDVICHILKYMKL